MYFIKSGSKLEITETGTSASVTAVVSSRALPAGKLEYKFEKIINNGFMFYRLIEVKRVEPPDDALEKASVESQTLTDHFVRFVLKEEAIDLYYTFDAEDVFRFIASLCVYRDDPLHPYSHMVKTDDTASYYTVSYADARQIAYEVFGIEYFSPNDYPTELYNAEKESYYFPFGAGLWTTQFAYVNMTSFERDGLIYAECHLVNSKLYEYPDADYGVYDFEFEYNDTDEPFITLKRIIAVG